MHFRRKCAFPMRMTWAVPRKLVSREKKRKKHLQITKKLSVFTPNTPSTIQKRGYKTTSMMLLLAERVVIFRLRCSGSAPDYTSLANETGSSGSSPTRARSQAKSIVPRQSLQFGTRGLPIRLLGTTEHLGRQTNSSAKKT